MNKQKNKENIENASPQVSKRKSLRLESLPATLLNKNQVFAKPVASPAPAPVVCKEEPEDETTTCLKKWQLAGANKICINKLLDKLQDQQDDGILHSFKFSILNEESLVVSFFDCSPHPHIYLYNKAGEMTRKKIHFNKHSGLFSNEREFQMVTMNNKIYFYSQQTKTKRGWAKLRKFMKCMHLIQNGRSISNVTEDELSDEETSSSLQLCDPGKKLTKFKNHGQMYVLNDQLKVVYFKKFTDNDNFILRLLFTDNESRIGIYTTEFIYMMDAELTVKTKIQLNLTNPEKPFYFPRPQGYDLITNMLLTDAYFIVLNSSNEVMVMNRDDGKLVNQFDITANEFDDVKYEAFGFSQDPDETWWDDSQIGIYKNKYLVSYVSESKILYCYDFLATSFNSANSFELNVDDKLESMEFFRCFNDRMLFFDYDNDLLYF